MIQTRLRKIARLEKLAEPYIARRLQIEKQRQLLPFLAVAHAAVLAFVIRYGEPVVGEPLSCAFRRVCESDAWGRYHDEFPSSSRKDLFPSHKDGVLLHGLWLRFMVLAEFPGGDEKEKLDRVFRVPDRGSGNPTPLGGWDGDASGAKWFDGSVQAGQPYRLGLQVSPGLGDEVPLPGSGWRCRYPMQRIAARDGAGP
jgi:hypothetical protein